MGNEKTTEITPEEVYAEWHRAFNEALGRHVRRCRNFDPAKDRSDWENYVNAAKFYSRLRSRIDWKILIKALASHHGGWFHPKNLYGMRAIGIYNDYVKKMESSTPEELEESEIVDRIKRSIVFVCSYMMERRISDLQEYFSENMDSYPTMALHHESGDVDFHFLAAVPYLKELLNSYPQDVVADAFPAFEERYLAARKDIMFRPGLRKIADNIEKLVGAYIEKMRKIQEND